MDKKQPQNLAPPERKYPQSTGSKKIQLAF